MSVEKSTNSREKLLSSAFRSRWMKVVSVMAGIVVFVTTYAMILPAITMTNKTVYCGREEHVHTGKCYDSAGTLLCGLEEHTHTLQCYSDSYADIESEDEWVADLPANSGESRTDVVAAAKSQLGYKESDENYLVGGGDRIQGYSRYGHWYGEQVSQMAVAPAGDSEKLQEEPLNNGLSGYAYAKWDAMFVSFVLYHAGVTELGLEEDVDRWIDYLNTIGRYTDSDEYMPEPGDLVFFVPDENSGVCVGIVSRLNTGFLGQGKVIKSISAVTGDYNNCVEEIKIGFDGSSEEKGDFPRICGYGVLSS